MIFAAVLAVAQLSALIVFPLLRKKFNRKQLYFGSMVSVTFAYLLFFFSFEHIAPIVVAGLALFFAQAIIQLLMLLFLADSIEYGEWKLGKRSEAASFAVQPFVNQIGGAISKGVLSLTLIVSGINGVAKKLEGITNEEISSEIIANIPGGSIWVMKLGMMIFPLICIVVGFILYMTKFRIDEKFYQQILDDLESRAASGAKEAEPVLAEAGEEVAGE